MIQKNTQLTKRNKAKSMIKSHCFSNPNLSIHVNFLGIIILIGNFECPRKKIKMENEGKSLSPFARLLKQFKKGKSTLKTKQVVEGNVCLAESYAIITGAEEKTNEFGWKRSCYGTDGSHTVCFYVTVSSDDCSNWASKSHPLLGERPLDQTLPACYLFQLTEGKSVQIPYDDNFDLKLTAKQWSKPCGMKSNIENPTFEQVLDVIFDSIHRKRAVLEQYEPKSHHIPSVVLQEKMVETLGQIRTNTLQRFEHSKKYIQFLRDQCWLVNIDPFFQDAWCPKTETTFDDHLL